MSAAPAGTEAVVTALRWRLKSGEPRTTLVAKLTMELDPSGPARWARPTPLVAFDRVASDPRYVAEASELAPWAPVASVVPLGGPLHFTLERPGAAPVVVTTAAQGPAGFSMASPERAALARERPQRTADGLLSVSPELDGRYFVAAPPAWQLERLRGDETFVIELSGLHVRARLPGVAVVITAHREGRPRVVVATWDMLVIEGAERRVSLVGRVVLHGEATVVTHTLEPLSAIAGLDRGDAPTATFREDETRDVGALELAALAGARPVAPAAAPDDLDLAIPVPATPFDPGFAPAPVVPAAGVAETLMPVGSMEEQLKALRAQLRKDGDG